MTTEARQSVFRRMPVDQMDEIERDSGAGALAKSLGLWQLASRSTNTSRCRAPAPTAR